MQLLSFFPIETKIAIFLWKSKQKSGQQNLSNVSNDLYMFLGLP